MKRVGTATPVAEEHIKKVETRKNAKRLRFEDRMTSMVDEVNYQKAKQSEKQREIQAKKEEKKRLIEERQRRKEAKLPVFIFANVQIKAGNENSAKRILERDYNIVFSFSGEEKIYKVCEIPEKVLFSKRTFKSGYILKGTDKKVTFRYEKV